MPRGHVAMELSEPILNKRDNFAEFAVVCYGFACTPYLAETLRDLGIRCRRKDNVRFHSMYRVGVKPIFL